MAAAASSCLRCGLRAEEFYGSGSEGGVGGGEAMIDQLVALLKPAPLCLECLARKIGRGRDEVARELDEMTKITCAFSSCRDLCRLRLGAHDIPRDLRSLVR
jgi:hypothetical protein